MSRSEWCYPAGTLAAPFNPVEVDGITLAFPANIEHLLPPADDIPDAFWSDGNKESDRWRRLCDTLFFGGVRDLELHDPRVEDNEVAWNHIRAILGSYQPKHQYKQAAVAYLLSLWWKSASWKNDAGKKEKA